MSTKLTPWFSESAKPVRKGVYQTRFYLNVTNKYIEGYAYWSGSLWANQQPTADAALSHYSVMHKGIQDKQWKGLLK